MCARLCSLRAHWEPARWVRLPPAKPSYLADPPAQPSPGAKSVPHLAQMCINDQLGICCTPSNLALLSVQFIETLLDSVQDDEGIKHDMHCVYTEGPRASRSI